MSLGLYEANLVLIRESDEKEMSFFVCSRLGGMAKSLKEVRHSPCGTSPDDAHDRRRVESNAFICGVWERPSMMPP